MSKLYKVTIFGESFLIGWFPFSSRWYNKLKIIKGYALALCDVNGKRVYITCYDLEKKPFVSTNGEE